MYKDCKVNGTLMWYYGICKREVWLMYRNITPDEKDVNIDIGRFIHEESYKRNPKEIEFGGVKFDVLEKSKNGITIGEMKKTSKYSQASRYQLLYYLKQLKEAGIDAKGVLMYPEEKKRENVILNDENEKMLDNIINEISEIELKIIPPKINKIPFCKNCAYKEYCYS